MPLLAASQVIRTREQAVEINSVLRNTYMLLALMIAVCAGATVIAVQMNWLPPFWIMLVGIFALPFAIQATARSPIGLLLSFVYAAFLGWIGAPLISDVLQINAMLITQALGITAATFIGLSMYTIVRRADFSWLGQFLTISSFAILGVIILRLLGVDFSPFEMLISAFMIIFASALILFQTSQIVLGGERNYIIAATTLFAGLWILFMYILQFLAIFSGRE
ncbi:MAG: FtsH protease modulator YccA [Gammaproteobacteria bacterium]|nr:FtsH protease modulator YccA [Gammaproteobacteria bacterium]MYI77917.1 FtsH protease modulator YccA [Gammaproteobacteria bacterium]